MDSSRRDLFCSSLCSWKCYRPQRKHLSLHLPHLPQCVRFQASSFLRDSLIASYPYIEGIAFWSLNFMWFGCLLWPGGLSRAPLCYETLRSSLLGIPLLYLGSVLVSGYFFVCIVYWCNLKKFFRFLFYLVFVVVTTESSIRLVTLP